MLSDQQTDTIVKANTINLNALQFFGPTSNAMSKSTYSNVKINGSTAYDSFEMIDGGIDFELSQNGSVKIVLGAYAASKSGTTQDSVLPAIYKVNRSSDNKTVESYKKITHVYESSGIYYYKYSDNTTDSIPSDATEVCNLEKMYSGCFKQKCAYYIEIPLNSGDYWFGADDTKNMSSFILYLDIGSNAGDSGGGSSGGSYTINNVRYVHEIKDETTKGDSYVDILFTIATAAATGDSKIYFKRYSESLLYYHAGDGSNFTITLLKTASPENVEDSTSAIWTSSSTST